MEVLLDVGVDKIKNGEHHQRKDLFLYAVENKKWKMAKLFLERKTHNINTAYYHETDKFHKYQTAAYLAVQNEDAEMLAQLIELGADINAKNTHKDHENSFPDDKRFALSCPLIASVSTESNDCFEVLINTPGVDLNAQSDSITTALVKALKSKKYDRAHKLLDKGADASIGISFHYAIASNDVKLIEKILALKADPKMNYNGPNVWHLAAKLPETDPEIFELLGKSAAKNIINHQDIYSCLTPLATAVVNCNLKGFNELLKLNADSNITFNRVQDKHFQLRAAKGERITLLKIAEATLLVNEGKLPSDPHNKEILENVKSVKEMIRVLKS